MLNPAFKEFIRLSNEVHPLADRSAILDNLMTDTVGMLVITRTGAPDLEFEFSKSTLTLGRASTNDIVLNDTRVSRFHARIDCSQEGCTVIDLDSTNGIQVNGENVKKAVLSPGDSFKIGDNDLRFERERLKPDLAETMIDSEAELDRMIDCEILPMAINETGQPQLVVFSKDKTWEVSLEEVELLKIGRADDNDLVLPYEKVSRYHAELARQGDIFVLRDLKSTNGTFSKDKRIDQMILVNGALFRIGPAQLFYKSGFSDNEVTMVNETLEFIQTKKPVIFIPGFMGSELWQGSERVWPNVKYYFKNPDIFKYSDAEPNTLMPGGVVDEVVVVPNLIKFDRYNRLGDYFVEELKYERGVNFFEFAYDWRQDVRRSAQKLSQMIDGLKLSQPVTIIAHSLGTLVTRYYLTRLGGNKKVERVMLMGGPHRGVPRIVFNLLVGATKIPLGAFGERIRQIGLSLPALYQILPTTDFTLENSDKKINFLEYEGWLPEENRRLLRSAREFRKEIGSRLNVPTVSIFGYGLKTITDLSVGKEPDGNIKITKLHHELRGDSEIPESSAILDGSEFHPVQQFHGSLYVDNDVKMRLKLELTLARFGKK